MKQCPVQTNIGFTVKQVRGVFVSFPDSLNTRIFLRQKSFEFFIVFMDEDGEKIGIIFYQVEQQIVWFAGFCLIDEVAGLGDSEAEGFIVNLSDVGGKGKMALRHNAKGRHQK